MSALTIHSLSYRRQQYEMRMRAEVAGLIALRDNGTYETDPEALPELQRCLTSYFEESAEKNWHQGHRPWRAELEECGLVVYKYNLKDDDRRACVRVEQPGWQFSTPEPEPAPAYHFGWLGTHCFNPIIRLEYDSPQVHYKVYITGDNNGQHGAGWWLSVKLAANDTLWKYGKGFERLPGNPPAHVWPTADIAAQDMAKSLWAHVGDSRLLNHKVWKPHLWQFNSLRRFIGVKPIKESTVQLQLF